jgi:LacI family transcriptional regulator
MKAPHINLQDVAQRANAPVDQVAKVILGQPDVPVEIRKRVLEVMRDVGVEEMTGQSAAAHTTIGVAVPRTMVDDYIGQVSLSVSETITQHGFSPISINVQNPNWENELTRLMNSGGCSGIVMIVPNNLDRLVEFCHQFNRPYVLVDYQGDDDIGAIPTVEVNNRQSIIQVMRYLFELGHQRIGFITGRLDHASARQRLQGYWDALTEAGIVYDNELVVEGDWEHSLAYEQAKKLLHLSDCPTAIVASNDLSAFGAVQAANEAGLVVGSDISITGFDDIPLATSLTTVRQPMSEIGKRAAEMLIKLLKGKKVSPLHVQLDTELIVRTSTGKPHFKTRP